jgi:hypothetical protein
MSPLSTFEKAIASVEKAKRINEFSKNDDTQHVKTVRRTRLKGFCKDNDFKILFELPSDFLSYEAFIHMIEKLTGAVGIETISFVFANFTSKVKEQRRQIDPKLRDSIVCESISRLYDSISRTELELGIAVARVQNLQENIVEKNETIYHLVNDNKLLSMELINKCEMNEGNQIISDCGLFTLRKIVDQNLRNQWYYESKAKGSSNTDDEDVIVYNSIANSIKSEFEIDCSVYRNEQGCLTLFCIVEDGEIEDKFLSIRALHGGFNLCIRDGSFIFSNLELLYKIPMDLNFDPVNICWHHFTSSEDSIVCGISSGPYFDGSAWTNQSAVWIFSKYGGFIDIDFPIFNEYKFHIFESRRQSLADYERTDVDTGLFSGLRMYAEYFTCDLKLARHHQSVGPYIEIKNNSETIKGVLSTRHTSNKYKNGYLQDDDEIFIEFDGSGKELLGKVKTFGIFDSPLLTTENNSYVVNDFVVVECEIEGSLKISIAEDEENICNFISISRVGDVSSSKIVSKVGQKTGYRSGLYINTVYMFKKHVNPPPPEEYGAVFGENMYKCATSGNIFPCSYILVYDCDNKFADKGDSGGLCFVKEDSGEVVGVGIVGAVILCSRLFLVIPLTSIAQAIHKNFEYDVKFE